MLTGLRSKLYAFNYKPDIIFQTQNSLDKNYKYHNYDVEFIFFMYVLFRHCLLHT